MRASGKKEAKRDSKSDLKNEIKKELKAELKIELKTGSKNEKESGKYTGHKPIPMKIANKVLESICKITVETKEGKSYGTGFFYELFRFIKMFNGKLSCNKSKC